ncbi:hypothetical protein MgSA37_02604 [Mucilaginibacter gotjawali]|uniref:Uncharacterized protein n=2 Tax=Mucilaginibacter gotjawali TaxID=1550579 RepID=A0A110B2R7_9SPHI|nr:hypothetical protein [Mucilaginibacter gotjawali]BAU54428.1 hypothetical protein MgSA37_02604 [Mucilaginibacter gotjawali]
MFRVFREEKWNTNDRRPGVPGLKNRLFRHAAWTHSNLSVSLKSTINKEFLKGSRTSGLYRY